MYSVEIDCHLILSVIILCSILSGAQLFVVWTNQCIFKNEMTLIIYLLPLFSTLGFLLLFIISSKISDCFYSFICLIIGLYLGYLLYIFQVAVIIRIIIIFLDISNIIYNSFNYLYIWLNKCLNN